MSSDDLAGDDSGLAVARDLRAIKVGDEDDERDVADIDTWPFGTLASSA
jgi:hypothetical protein